MVRRFSRVILLLAGSAVWERYSGKKLSMESVTLFK
jgi:hypothetical protein